MAVSSARRKRNENVGKPKGPQSPDSVGAVGLKFVWSLVGHLSMTRVERSDQWKLSPQAQEPVAFGLSMVKPCFSIVSTKSIVAPLR